MNYLPYAIAAPVFMAIGNYIQKLVVTDDEVHGGVFGGAYGLLVALLSLPFAIYFERLTISMFNLNVVLVLVAMTLLYSMAMWGFFTAMKYVPISEIVFLESATPIWVLGGSAVVLGETLSINKLLGVGLIVVGLLVAFRFKKVNRWSKYHTVGLISGIFYAGAYLTDKYLLGYLPSLYYQVFSFGLPSIVLLLVFGQRVAELSYFWKNKKARRIIWSSVFVGLGFYCLYTAYNLSNSISLINPIFETKALWAMLLGIILLNEKDNLRYKIISIILATLGVLLIK